MFFPPSRFTQRLVSPTDSNAIRAALLTVFMNSRNERSASLVGTLLRPMSMPEAIELLKHASGQAKFLAAARLVEAAYFSHLDKERQHWLRRHGAALVGSTKELQLWNQLQNTQGLPDDIAGISFEYFAFDVPVPPGREGNPPPKEKNFSKFDPKTMVTTAKTSTKVKNMTPQEMARLCDPQNWGSSQFFPKVYWLDPSGKPLVLPHGTPHKGLFYEHALWNWNGTTLSGFQNHLFIEYSGYEPRTPAEQDADKGNLISKVSYRLSVSKGSVFLGMVLPFGVDVDCGVQCVYQVQEGGSKEPHYRVETVKKVRFSDLLTRRTPGQGVSEAGQLFSFTAPAVVEVWLYELGITYWSIAEQHAGSVGTSPSEQAISR